MINAIRNGQKGQFSERSWELLGPGKEGWQEVKVEAPSEVKAAIKPAKGEKKPDASGKKTEAVKPVKGEDAADAPDDQVDKEATNL